eukprot:TRINITY_DN111316_c0_g1_i1.p1 TRINITY_DN111316_c0_g1~~TRINITY_DN111316_c0_g1_i1.p1  ORF type:complete len:507 (+),score=165.08 TRINITY_DN111316_c0_g1_i1:77-1597(+)
MARKALSELKLEDIDFDVIKECTDKNYLKKYIKLIEDDGSYFIDLLNACKNKLLEVAPKEYYLLYPRSASAEEIDEATKDLLAWEDNVKEIDESLKRSKQAEIFDDIPGLKVSAPIRGQEAVHARPNVQKKEGQPKAMEDKDRKKDDVYARDKTRMKDYYSAWDKVDVDKLEEELDEEERAAEEARQKHFEDMKDEQEQAQAFSKVGDLPTGVPEAHRKHMADSEKEKGNEAFYARDWEEAEAYYSRSIHYRPDDPSTWSNRALVRLKQDKPQKALEDCEHALALNGQHVKALHRKGKALFELRRYEDAVRAFQLALAESPGNSQINGDLMVARKKLRLHDDVNSMPGRPVDAEPSCRIEELDDDEPANAAASTPLPAGYTRIMIEEDSDSEDDEPAPPKPPVSTGGSTGSGFKKIVIEEASGSESEDELPTSPKAPATSSRQEEQAASAAPALSANGFRKVAIVEESDSEDEAPQKSSGSFAPPPRTAATTAPAPEAAVSFDDMD